VREVWKAHEGRKVRIGDNEGGPVRGLGRERPATGSNPPAWSWHVRGVSSRFAKDLFAA